MSQNLPDEALTWRGKDDVTAPIGFGSATTVPRDCSIQPAVNTATAAYDFSARGR